MVDQAEKVGGKAGTLTARSWNWWQLACLGAMCLYLLSPVLLYELGLSSAREGGGIDKITLFALPASVLWLFALHLSVRRPWIAHAVLFPFYVLVGIDLFLIASYQTRLTSSTITVILENWADAPSYFRERRGRILGATGLVLALYVFGMIGIRRLVLPAKRRWLLASLGALAFLYLAVGARQALSVGTGAAALDVVSHDRNSPLGVLPQGYIALRVYRQVAEHRQAARAFVFGAKRPSAPSEPELFVLVLGESSRRDHWGLYGYPRETTPGLAAEPKLVTFTNVVTQAALTQLAVPLSITRNTIDHMERPENSVVSLFRELGFTTHWFSTQQRDQYTGAVNGYSSEASDVRFLDRQYDIALVELMKHAAPATDAAGKHFFLLHTQGSHGAFEDRYPPENRRFSVGPELSERERFINSYDNTIAYTDLVLSELVALLKQHSGITAMLYVADHGENLRDDARKLVGHFFNNEYDLPIPMVFWYSEAFEHRYPEKVAAMKRSAALRVSTTSIFYTLADLAGVVLDDPRLQTSSLASPRYEPGPRRVVSRWESLGSMEWVDYDEQFGNVVGAMRGEPPVGPPVTPPSARRRPPPTTGGPAPAGSP
jgi:glucan phosphoethanolaminetransferase (alkaline phosphatase superfamily)